MAKHFIHGAPSQSSCDAIGRLLATITRRWTLHILWVLISEGPTRFGALRRSVHGFTYNFQYSSYYYDLYALSKS